MRNNERMTASEIRAGWKRLQRKFDKLEEDGMPTPASVFGKSLLDRVTKRVEELERKET